MIFGGTKEPEKVAQAQNYVASKLKMGEARNNFRSGTGATNGKKNFRYFVSDWVDKTAGTPHMHVAYSGIRVNDYKFYNKNSGVKMDTFENFNQYSRVLIDIYDGIKYKKYPADLISKDLSESGNPNNIFIRKKAIFLTAWSYLNYDYNLLLTDVDKQIKDQKRYYDICYFRHLINYCLNIEGLELPEGYEHSGVNNDCEKEARTAGERCEQEAADAEIEKEKAERLAEEIERQAKKNLEGIVEQNFLNNENPEAAWGEGPLYSLKRNMLIEYITKNFRNTYILKDGKSHINSTSIFNTNKGDTIMVMYRLNNIYYHFGYVTETRKKGKYMKIKLWDDSDYVFQNDLGSNILFADKKNVLNYIYSPQGAIPILTTKLDLDQYWFIAPLYIILSNNIIAPKLKITSLRQFVYLIKRFGFNENQFDYFKKKYLRGEFNIVNMLVTLQALLFIELNLGLIVKYGSIENQNMETLGYENVKLNNKIYFKKKNDTTSVVDDDDSKSIKLSKICSGYLGEGSSKNIEEIADTDESEEYYGTVEEELNIQNKSYNEPIKLIGVIESHNNKYISYIKVNDEFIKVNFDDDDEYYDKEIKLELVQELPNKNDLWFLYLDIPDTIVCTEPKPLLEENSIEELRESYGQLYTDFDLDIDHTLLIGNAEHHIRNIQVSQVKWDHPFRPPKTTQYNSDNGINRCWLNAPLYSILSNDYIRYYLRYQYPNNIFDRFINKLTIWNEASYFQFINEHLDELISQIDVKIDVLNGEFYDHEDTLKFIKKKLNMYNLNIEVINFRISNQDKIAYFNNEIDLNTDNNIISIIMTKRCVEADTQNHNYANVLHYYCFVKIAGKWYKVDAISYFESVEVTIEEINNEINCPNDNIRVLSVIKSEDENIIKATKEEHPNPREILEQQIFDNNYVPLDSRENIQHTNNDDAETRARTYHGVLMEFTNINSVPGQTSKSSKKKKKKELRTK